MSFDIEDGVLLQEQEFVNVLKVIGYCVTFPSSEAKQRKMTAAALKCYEENFDGRETKENFAVFIATLLTIFGTMLNLLSPPAPTEPPPTRPN